MRRLILKFKMIHKKDSPLSCSFLVSISSYYLNKTALIMCIALNRWNQEDLSYAAKLNRDTGKACSNSEYIPSGKTMKKI